MWRRIGIVISVLILLFIINAFLNPIPSKNSVAGNSPLYGVSYSFEQAGWYGLNGREAFVSLIENNDFDWVRLSFFWDQMTSESGELKVESLKFAIEEAGKRDIDVIIAIGAKTPYHPEYHLPKRIENKLAFGDRIDINHPVAKDILAVDKKVIEELMKYENITHWQVENEPLLGNINNWHIDKSLLIEEIKQVRKLDTRSRPIIINHVGPSIFDNQWKGLSDLLEPGDVFGANAYYKTQGVDLIAFEIGDKEVHIRWPEWFVWPVQSWGVFSPDFENMKKEIEAKGLEFWILEMQAEPFIKNLDDAARNNGYFQARNISEADEYLRSMGIKNIGLWGAPYWLYRQSQGDNSWLDEVDEIVN